MSDESGHHDERKGDSFEDDREHQCDVDDPRVSEEAIAITAMLAARLSAHRRRVNTVLWIGLLLALGATFLAGKNGVDMQFKGWLGLVAAVVCATPLGILIAWQIRGSTAIKRQVYCEAGLQCLACHHSCQGTLDDDMLDWLMARECPKCGGQVKRYAEEYAA